MDSEEVFVKLTFNGVVPELGITTKDALGGRRGEETIMVLETEFDPPGPVTASLTM